ncbi:MAG: helix-turn-helix domain-containing protein [Tissierellales bacterium]
MLPKKITAGENLKRIRKDLNLKQHEIAGNDVTRNLISLIENNKTPIYYNVANIISKNINKILCERGLDIYIQAEDILNPERYEARSVANNYIKMLEKHLQEKNYNLKVDELNEIENFLNKWNFVDK